MKIAGVVLVVSAFFGLTSLAVLLGFDERWDGIDVKNGFSSFDQWATLVTYRICLYCLPGVVLSFFRFDKRFKYISRLTIWLNWTFAIYLLAYAIIKVFAIDIALKTEVLKTIDSVVVFAGYVITFITKKKVEFDSTGAIIDPKKS